MAVVRGAEDPKAAQVEAELRRASAPSGAKPPMGRNEIVLFLLEHRGTESVWVPVRLIHTVVDPAQAVRL